MPVQSDALKPLAKEWVTQIPMGRLAEVTDLEVHIRIIADRDAVCCLSCVTSCMLWNQFMGRCPLHCARLGLAPAQVSCFANLGSDASLHRGPH